MNTQDLQNIIAKGEGKHVEFLTETASERVARIVCAFLNGSGGRLLLGVDDQGQLLGVANAEENSRRLENELPALISPRAVWTVQHLPANDHSVLVVEVPEGQDKPYVVGGAIYFRRHGQVVTATRDEISSLIRRRTEASQRWERQVALGADREDLDNELVLQTIQRARESQRWQGAQDDIDGFLNELGLVLDGSLTNAGLLLYGRAPTRLLPQARVRMLVLPESKTGDRYSVDRLFERCLLQTAKEIPEALNVYLGGVESRFSGGGWERSDRPIYPASALREGIMNALIHRDYSQSSSITISIQHAFLRVSNPGGLPSELKLSDLKRDHLSLPRNPDIAHICFLHGLIEKVGRGTQRIVEDCRKAQLREPKWHTSALETTLTLFSHASLTSPQTSQDLNDRQQQILKALNEGRQLRPSDVTKLVGTGVTDRTVRSDLQGLVDLGLLIRRGRGRSISYVASKGSPKS